MSEPRDKPTKRKRSGVVSCACLCMAFLAIVWLGLVWSPVVFASSAAKGTLGEWYWAVDLCASLAAQSVVGVVVVLVSVAALRRRVCAGVVGCVLVGLLVLPLSEPRLASAPGDAEAVRLLVYNSHTQSNDVELKNALLSGAGVDVAVVLEISTGMMRSYIAGRGFRATHGFGMLPRSEWSGCPAILSRFEVEPHESELGRRLRKARRDLWDHLYRIEVVHAPTGSFVLIQAHVRSPRRPERWAYGLGQLRQLATIVGEVREITGLPIVVAGDFNSPPTSVRARAFADLSGLVRAKPAYTLSGSFPAAAPSWAALAIDGVYASPGVRVKSWEPIGSAGSDHRAVVIELVID